MRTTVDYPPAVRQQIDALARENNLTVSSAAVDLTIRGLATLKPAIPVRINSRSGFPAVNTGRPVSAREVEDFLAED